jgi:putative ABC transport system ATP-binding protein
MARVVEVSGLHKTYALGDERVHALRGVDLALDAGEFVAVMGPSGSGKSTFMHVVGLLDTPTAGTYRFEGADVSSLSADERADIRGRRLGFVFQAYNLLPRTSAVENVELPMVYAGVSETERRSIAGAKLEVIGIPQLANHHPNQMSGGQQQRVAIARALVNDPGLILADEPTGALDTQTSRDIMRLFARLNEEQGITIMVVTHEPDVAAYARRIVTFRDGLITSDTRNERRAA